MIKRIAPLLALSIACAGSELYLLPDDHSRFVHRLGEAVKNERGDLLLFTPRLRHAGVKKILLQGARKGSRIVVLTRESDGDPLYLAQYDGIEVRTCSSRPLAGSVIVVAEKLVCSLPLPIEQEGMGSAAALVQCSDDPAETAAYRAALLPFLRRCDPYLR